MLNGEMVDARFVFDRQARSHIILTCKELTKEKLGLDRRPSYWDLPIELQANLVRMMVRCGTAFASKLGLPSDDTDSWHMEIHLGTWVVSTMWYQTCALVSIAESLTPFVCRADGRFTVTSWSHSLHTLRSARPLHKLRGDRTSARVTAIVT